MFYQVKPSRLFLYAELGMSFAKLGEEARVPLDDFSLAGSQHRALRSTMNRLTKEGLSFRIVEAVDVPAVLPQLASTAPHSAMDGLFAHLFLWGRECGYRWFNLGMAPLSGLAVSPVSSAWVRLGKVIYRHGEAFYNFEGLRAYKEKFHPVWEPRYIAYPGKTPLLLVLADIAALVGGRLCEDLPMNSRKMKHTPVHAGLMATAVKTPASIQGVVHTWISL